jgi:hypothetical protein
LHKALVPSYAIAENASPCPYVFIEIFICTDYVINGQTACYGNGEALLSTIMHSIERARSLRHRFVLCIIVVENRCAGLQQPSFCTIFRRKFRLVKVAQNSNWMSYLVSYFQQRMHRNHLFLCCATFLYSKVPKTDFESKTRKIFTSPNGRWEPKLGLQPGPPPKSPKIHTCGGSPQLLKSLKCFWGMKFACINALLIGFH